MSDKMSDSVLTKLSAADADLAAQEAKLASQLEAIQAKRASLQSVLEIFNAKTTTTNSKQTNSKQTAAIETALDQQVTIASTAIAVETVDSPMATASEASRRRQASRKQTKPTHSRKAASGPKSNRRGWREYLRDEYRQQPLPSVVAGVLQGHPKKVFEIAEVVDTIFVQPIPKAARKGARERVSNILAEGARKNQWLRGESGRYCFSK